MVHKLSSSVLHISYHIRETKSTKQKYFLYFSRRHINLKKSLDTRINTCYNINTTQEWHILHCDRREKESATYADDTPGNDKTVTYEWFCRSDAKWIAQKNV